MCAKKYISHCRKINATFGPVFCQVSEGLNRTPAHFDNRISFPEPTSNETSALNASRHWAARHGNAGIREDMWAAARAREESIAAYENGLTLLDRPSAFQAAYGSKRPSRSAAFLKNIFFRFGHPRGCPFQGRFSAQFYNILCAARLPPPYIDKNARLFGHPRGWLNDRIKSGIIPASDRRTSEKGYGDPKAEGR